MKWLAEVKHLTAIGKPDASLDTIYNNIDDMLLAGCYSEVNELLDTLNVSEYSTDNLIGFLVTSSWGGLKTLPNRLNFFFRVKEELGKRKLDEPLETLLADLL